jgi:hypothetical protein
VIRRPAVVASSGSRWDSAPLTQLDFLLTQLDFPLTQLDFLLTQLNILFATFVSYAAHNAG